MAIVAVIRVSRMAARIENVQRTSFALLGRARNALALLLGASLAGCGTTGALPELQEAAGAVILPPAEAEKLGERLASEFEQQAELHPSEEVQAWISDLGQRLARAAEETPQPIDYTFKVVDAPDTVNAFALPGGEIYVYSGLLRVAESEAEVASVLAHEIAHVAERHVAERLATSYGLQALTGAALGQDAGTLAQLVSGLVQQGFLLEYGRDQESQADVTGIDYMIEAGYDPHAAVDMFRKLAQGEGNGPPEFLRSHPTFENRIEEAREVIRQRGDVPDYTGRERYQQLLQEL